MFVAIRQSSDNFFYRKTLKSFSLNFNLIIEKLFKNYKQFFFFGGGGIKKIVLLSIPHVQKHCCDSLFSFSSNFQRGKCILKT